MELGTAGVEREKTGLLHKDVGKRADVTLDIWFRSHCKSTTSGRFAGHRRRHRAAGFHDVAQDTVDRVFIKDVKVSD